MGLFSKQQSTFDPAKDLPDLAGKVVIVTGGNSGIGFATVQHLARHGAKVYIGARNEAKAKDAIERLRTQGLGPGNGEVDWFALDLSDPRNAKKSAQAFFEKEKRLDVLINNAGIMADTGKVDSNGVIEPMTVNLLSTAAFTTAFLPLLTQTAKEPDSDVRIVFVSSDSMAALKKREMRFRDVNDLNEQFSGSFSFMSRYGKSKLAALLYAKELQRKLDAEGYSISVIAVHPGAVFTEGVATISNAPIIGPFVNFLLKRVFLTPTEGAYTSVFAAASPTVKSERDSFKGAFIVPGCKLSEPPNPQANSKELAKEVWTTTETLLKQWAALD